MTKTLAAALLIAVACMPAHAADKFTCTLGKQTMAFEWLPGDLAALHKGRAWSVEQTDKFMMLYSGTTAVVGSRGMVVDGRFKRSPAALIKNGKTTATGFCVIDMSDGRGLKV